MILSSAMANIIEFLTGFITAFPVKYPNAGKIACEGPI
jgi:hypothetical protein